MGDEDLERLKSHIAQLGEHFDTVQIFVTRYVAEDDGTVAAQYGSGNWYARYGLIKEWVVKQEQIMKQEMKETD